MYNLEKTISNLKELITASFFKVASKNDILNVDLPKFEVEIPANRSHGDLSTNIAMVSAKTFKMPPRKISEEILKFLKNENQNIFKNVEIAGPGFINFFLKDNFFSDTLKEIKNFDSNFGNSDFGKNKKIMVEFVSANPTGPMHMGNARLGALGDCLSAILKKTGFNVYKEFYVNDAGNQIEKFGLSLDVRYQQICKPNENIPLPEECYQGQDITELAQEFYNNFGISYIDKDFNTRKTALVNFALPKNISRMQKDMEKYKIKYDNWFYESTLHESGEVINIIQK
ncbi:MAG: arginine--tRNA ligase [Clostridia bacterium]|nr:arginine--tRNA ligase [Clostridia bacterium]